MPTTPALLPHSIERSRILTSAQAATFWGVSLPHWRRMYWRKKVPAPIRIGDRKYGWRAGDLIDALEARVNAA